MPKLAVICMVLAAVDCLFTTSATMVFFTNHCASETVFWDAGVTKSLATGATYARSLGDGFHGMFHLGATSRATLSEFTIAGGRAWFDISIIPPGSGNCQSLQQCQQVSGGVGFNVPMRITPRASDVPNCHSLECTHDGCSDAYQYPPDNSKTHDCASHIEFDVVFCPGEASRSAASTSAPVTTVPASTSTLAVSTLPLSSKVSTMPSIVTTQAQDSSSNSSNATITVQSEVEVVGTTKPIAAGQTVTLAPRDATTKHDDHDSSNNIAWSFLILLGAVCVMGILAIVLFRRRQARLDQYNAKSPISGLVSFHDMSTPHESAL